MGLVAEAHGGIAHNRSSLSSTEDVSRERPSLAFLSRPFAATEVLINPCLATAEDVQKRIIRKRQLNEDPLRHGQLSLCHPV